MAEEPELGKKKEFAELIHPPVFRDKPNDNIILQTVARTLAMRVTAVNSTLHAGRQNQGDH